MNLYEAFLNSVDRHAERCALLWEDRSMTFAELAAQVQCAINCLAQHERTDPPHVGLLAPNTPHFVAGLYAILGSGCVALPWNPLTKPDDIAFLSKHAGSKLLLYDPALKSSAEAVQANFEDGFEILSVAEAVEKGASLPTAQCDLPGEDTTAMILYTSGTTGDPKGVMLSHKNLYSNYVSYVDVFHFHKEHLFLTVLPLFHSYAMTTNLFGALLSGASMRLFVQFDPHALLRSITTEKNLVLTAVPPMFHFLARRAPEGIAENHGLAFSVSGGGPLPVEVNHMYSNKFGVELLEGYGLTETSPVVAVNRMGQNRIGTIGHALPGVEVVVRDESGRDLPANEVGELNVRGDLVMQGYYRAPELTRKVFWEDGWFRTGDLSTIDEDGYIRIVGRLKDLIVDSGENIYPREIEEILICCPGVLEVAVVGHPHRVRSEVPHAFIVLDPDAPRPLTEMEIRAFAREHLAKYKIPELFTFRAQLPKTATNKVRKEILRQELEMLG
ncbi:MAG TPA: AMP-binding protein [bacterium]|nr:AMP-binding protein [bacterium]